MSESGNYTVALPADPSHTETSYPKGTGFGLITVSPTGSVWLSGVLGDQTEISAGANISVNGEVPFYTTAYGAKGGITGWMTLRDSTASNQVSGTFNWFKPATSTTLYPNAFTGRTTLTGSLYVARRPSADPHLRERLRQMPFKDGATNPSRVSSI